jgi:excisionase family DNA binding protein
MTLLEEVMQAAFGAPDDRKQTALKILRGEVLALAARPMTGPVLMGMGAAAIFLGVSRPTLWRMLQLGRIQRVELFPGSYRVRREDLEALVAGKLGMSGHVSKRGRPRKDSGQRAEVGGQVVGETDGKQVSDGGVR